MAAWRKTGGTAPHGLCFRQTLAEAFCFIIDNYGIFEGCETYLMQLEDGRVYGELLRDIFPYLRRVELRLS